MAKELYVERNFSAGSLAIIAQANTIIADYQRQGFKLTLRQLYYQFVARALLPNKQTEYKRLGSVINDGRLAGLIDWEAIEDRTRNLEENPHWSSPEAIIDGCAQQFRYDLWADQPVRPEVWIEKEALVGVIEPACKDLDIAYFACRGYSSQSEQWAAGKRIIGNARRNKQKTLILHLGDHDPSGIDMTRDNDERLAMFARQPILVSIKRLALNMEQVEQYSPPPNPAKMTDSRFGGYEQNFGDQSWELDALDPPVIDQLIRDAVEEIVDVEKMDAAKARQDEARTLLGRVSSQWDNVVANLLDDEE